MTVGVYMEQKPVELIEYGLANDRSDLRVHVCFGGGFVYIYKTADALQLLSRRYPVGKATQPGANGITGIGYTVPIGQIPGIQEIAIPWDLLAKARQCVNTEDTPSLKGKRAVQLVTVMFQRGLIPLPLTAQEEENTERQRDGIDLNVTGSVRVQVKCDWNGGRGGTGNLFLQTHERNPLKRL